MNMLRVIIQDVVYFLCFTFRKNIVFFSLVLYLCFSHSLTIAQVCTADSGIIKDVQAIACATSDLRDTVEKDNLLKKVSNMNFFSTLEPNDVVRSVETLSFFNRSLKNKIEDTHEAYQNAGKKSYTLHIASYPSQVKKGSCSQDKTIDFNSSTPYPDYQVIPGKTPRFFETRYYDDEFIVCEKTDIPYKKRLPLYCGKKVTKCKSANRTQDCSAKNAYRECKRELPISCDYVDKKGGKVPSQGMCLELDDFTDLSQGFLLYNNSLEKEYCPADCSYYTQTIQRSYQNKEDQDEYCTDSYLAVHCGPKKEEGKYNLNIKEVKNLCSDFDTIGCSH